MLLCTTVQNTRWSLLCSQFQSIAQGWTQHLFHVVIPTKGSTKSQTHTQQGQDSPKNALLCPTSSDEFHFLKFPKQQQQLETPVYTTWACGDAAQCRQRRSISWSPRLRPPHNTKCIWPPSKSPQSLNNSNTVQKSKCKVSFETKSTLLIVSPPRIKNVTYIQQYRADFSPLKWNGIYWERRNGAKTRRKSARQTGNPTALCPASGALMGCCELQQAWPVPSAPHALLGGAYNSCPKFSCPDTATGEQGSRVAEDELRAKSVSSPTSCVLGTH